MPKIEPKWSKKDFEKAEELWLAGHSATSVASILGKSRSAVVGKMKRAGLLRKDTGTQTVKVAAARKSPPPPLAPLTASSLHPVPLSNLKPHHCRAILGDVGKDGFAMYCGDPKAEGSSYCLFHYGLYTQPPKERVAHGETSQR